MSAALVASMSVVAARQVRLETVLKIVNDDIITLLDVRQAKLLKLVDLTSTADNDVAMRLVERRLELVEVTRSAPKEPTAQAVLVRRRGWEASVGAANVSQLLLQAGMTAANLEAWLRDDLRIAAYIESVFGARAVPTRVEMLAYYQEHLAAYTKAGVVQDFDAVAAEVRKTVQDARRAEYVKEWTASLVRRADVRDAR